VKTTVEIPRQTGGRNANAPAWMAGFGRLKRLRQETKRITRVIEREFEVSERVGPSRRRAR
jgi:hypothetical protein